MKKLLITLALLAVAVLGTAASAPTVTEGPVLPWRIQVDLAFDTSGSAPAVSSASPQVFYRQTYTVDGAEILRDRGSVTWDSVAKANETVSITLANGTTATTTRGAVLAAVLVIAASERTP